MATEAELDELGHLQAEERRFRRNLARAEKIVANPSAFGLTEKGRAKSAGRLADARDRWQTADLAHRERAAELGEEVRRWV